METVPNVDLFRKIASHIEANPNSWDNSCWARNATNRRFVVALQPTWDEDESYMYVPDVNDCGTTYCIAGWAATLSGYQVGTNGACIKADDPTRKRYDIIDVAVDLLGISYAQADPIFYANTTDLDEMKRIITKFTGVTFE